MEIIVQGHKVETKEIFRIVDIEHYKTMFMNREAGFIIELIDKPSIKVGERIPYESYPSQIWDKKQKWENLKKEVIKQWEQDKLNVPVFSVS